MKQEDLENLTNKQILAFFKTEDPKKLESPIKEFVLKGTDKYDMGRKINRVERLLSNIVVKRFINGKL